MALESAPVFGASDVQDSLAACCALWDAIASLVASGSFWWQDEAGAAAILATELDDALGGKAKQFRELQSHESEEFTQVLSSQAYAVSWVPTGRRESRRLVSSRVPRLVH